MEELLKQDREAGVPEPPEPSYTIAVLRRRLGEQAAPVGADGVEKPLIVAAVATVLGAGLLALLLGASPWWLLAVPCSALLLCPILLRKGA